MRFFRDINLVFLTYIANYLLAFAVSVLVARGLGTDGRGVYEIALLTISIAQAVMSLGVGVASLYYINKGTYPLSDLLSNSQFVVLASAALSGLLVLLAAGTFGPRLIEEDLPYWVFVFGVPLFLNLNLLTTFLQAQSRFLAMNSLLLLRPVIMLALLATGLAVGSLDTTNVLVFWSLSVLAAVVLGLLLVGARNLHLGTVFRPDWRVLRAQIRFGVQGQMGNVLQLLNYRFDKYVVLPFAGWSGVGIYGVGVGVTESIWFIANAVAVVLLPRLTSAHSDEAAQFTPVVCRNTLLLSLVAAAGLGVLSPLLLPLFFGEDFSPSVTAVWWLLPGTVALSGTKILSSYIFSQGRPLINTYITIASLAVTLAFDFALIPFFGVPGAAAASSVAYGSSLALSLAVYRRLSGRPIAEALFVRPSDVRMYVDAARTLGSRYLPLPQPAGDAEGPP
ncbi:MAG: polysaccharide biosynthesis C-terminal domain-containing protein [Dehalococcoidia bacterium]|nr:polysaccharide biosynthesis C-terminal domain-containing protein [Dehalococcoidia bacterium]